MLQLRSQASVEEAQTFAQKHIASKKLNPDLLTVKFRHFELHQSCLTKLSEVYTHLLGISVPRRSI